MKNGIDQEVCGIGRCKAEPSFGRIWSVPICDEHWRQCCAESASSLEWLHRKVKADIRQHLPKDDSSMVVLDHWKTSEVRKPVRVTAPLVGARAGAVKSEDGARNADPVQRGRPEPGSATRVRARKTGEDSSSEDPVVPRPPVRRVVPAPRLVSRPVRKPVRLLPKP
jgi:hypothetical protein